MSKEEEEEEKRLDAEIEDTLTASLPSFEFLLSKNPSSTSLSPSSSSISYDEDQKRRQKEQEQEELKKRVDARVEEMRQRMRQMSQLKLERNNHKSEMEPEVDQWNVKHKKKIALLLSNLHEVFPGIKKGQFAPSTKGEPTPTEIKRAYLKALLVVHPDKQGVDADAQQQLRAQVVFQTLTKSYERLQKKLKKQKKQTAQKM